MRDIRATTQVWVRGVAGCTYDPPLQVRTVERHVSNIYAKLRVSRKAARAAAAARFSRIREPPHVCQQRG